MTFKEKITKLRKQKGLTQDEFASAVGVSRQAVYKWESGQSYPEAQKLLEIKKLFDISIDDLLDDSYDVVIPEKKKRRRLPKEIKEQVETEVISAEEPAAEEPSVEAAVDETPLTVAEEAPVEPTLEESAPSAPIEESAFSEGSSDEDSDSDEPRKKVGFFGRIFGRK